MPYGEPINTYTNTREGENSGKERHTRTHSVDKREKVTSKQHHISMEINFSDKVKRCLANDLRLMNFSQDKQHACAPCMVYVCDSEGRRFGL